MLNSNKSSHEAAALFKNVQGSAKKGKNVPEGAMSLGVLKAVETQLQRKGLVQQTRGLAFFPLWFAAETERNVYLWRNGYSLRRQGEFEFWIDIDKLIAKRLTQLSLAADGIQISPAPLGVATSSAETADSERKYLLDLRDMIRRIEAHAHALSHVGLLIEKEIDAKKKRKSRIVLPA